MLAAACVAGSGVTLGTGHLHSTTTYDLLAWAVGLWLLVRSVTLAARLDNGQGVGNEEQGQPVWVCRGLIGTWRAPALHHYSG